MVALSATEVAKIFRGDTRSDIGSEAGKLKIANSINDLLVRFIRLDYNDEKDWDMLIMDRTAAAEAISAGFSWSGNQQTRIIIGRV